MKKAFFILLFSFIQLQAAFSQENRYAITSIPDSLKINANAVIREELMDVVVLSTYSQLIKTRRVITILNKEGENYADIYEYYDGGTRIVKLSASIHDAQGVVLKKYSKNKFKDLDAVDGGDLYSDSKIKYLDYTPTTYPYTVVFDSEVVTYLTGYTPNWRPIKGYYLSVEKSSYQLSISEDLTFRSKSYHFENFSIQTDKTKTTLAFELNNFKAFKYEKQSVSIKEIFPRAKISINQVSLFGVDSFVYDWNTFGKWVYESILKDRGKLSESTIEKIRKMTANAKSNIEKAKIVYDFVQNKTRYISVQVGIGGYQPVKAEEVDETGYGDCKGLTNYTKSLLNAVGVISYYTHVSAGEDKDSFDENFATLEGNHVILNIPNGEEDVWLECTSQTMPFGFLGDFTDDRNVLVITPNGGIIKKTPAYTNETNSRKTIASISLDGKGNVTADVERISKGIRYGEVFYLSEKSQQDLVKHYKSSVWSYNNNMDIADVQLTNNKEEIVFTEKIKAVVNEFATVIREEYELRVNIFDKYTSIPNRYRNRVFPLKVSRGFLDENEYTIKIPDGYIIGKLPETKELKTKFGVYKMSLEKLDEKTLGYKKYFLVKEGVYPKEDYAKYRKFLKRVSQFDNVRIFLTKK